MPIDAPNTHGSRTYTDNTYQDATPAYSYRVVALNKVGYGGQYMQLTVQSVSAPVVAGLLPAAPSNLNGLLSAGGGGPNGLQVALTWTDNANNETGFVVERRAALGTWSQIGSVTSPTPATSTGGTFTYTDTTVAPGMTYEYQVAAVNAAGSSPYSIPLFTIIVPTMPTAPSALTATAQAGPQVSVGLDGQLHQRDRVHHPARHRHGVHGQSHHVHGGSQRQHLHGQHRRHQYHLLLPRQGGQRHRRFGLVEHGHRHVVPRSPRCPDRPQRYIAGWPTGALTWTDNATNEDSYVVERADNGGAFAVLLGASALPANSAAYTDTTVLPGNNYKYRVAAVNAISGPSAYSNEATLAVPAIPAAPAPLVGVLQNPGSGPQVSLTWVISGAGGVETGFTLERSVNGGAFAALATPTAGTVSYIDTTVLPGRTYAYRVNAFNPSGTSAWTVSGTIAVPTVPAAPTGLQRTITRTTAGPDTVVLRWTDRANNETGFTIQRATDSGFTTNLTSLSVGTNVTRYTDAVAHGATYYYRVRAFNLGGASAWSVMVNVTTRPLTPTGFASTGATRTSISLAWNDISSNETGYRIHRRRVGVTAWTTVVTTAANATSYINTTGLVANTAYQYQIAGINGVGTSPWSPTITVSTLP